VTNVAGNTYPYDGNANLTNPGFLVYDYDAENQLKSVSYPNTQKTDFMYDGRSTLIWGHPLGLLSTGKKVFVPNYVLHRVDSLPSGKSTLQRAIRTCHFVF
jgi:hypothetical protein